MNSPIALFRPAKCVARIIGLTALMLATVASAQTETPKVVPGIKPIESLWFLTPPHVTGGEEAARTRALKEWQQVKVFDAYSMIKVPPTLADDPDFITRANAMIKEVGGRFIITSLPVGTEGWESSANPRLGQKLSGRYDASKAMTQLQWLESLKDLQVDTWAWVLEQPARMPTPEQAARSATEFVKFAKAQHKKTVIILTAQAFGRGPVEEMIRRICEATRADADYFDWMDFLEESSREGEANWRESADRLLDKILALSPKEKTVMQFEHNPRFMARDVAGTVAYISACQAKGINRFSVLSQPQGLNREPWREFYRTLPKTASAAK